MTGVQTCALPIYFSKSSGLAVNFHKSCMLPINVSEEQVKFLAESFGCVVGTFPFTYLGLPMGTTRPRILDLTPMVDKVQRRLTASSSFLAYGGRLQLIRSCLSSMPIFFLCSLDIPQGIIKQLNRIIRQCLWRGNNQDSSKQSLASWEMICKPKSSGGLGILDFKKQNQGLLMKQLHKFYNKEDLPWVNLVWRYYGNEVPHTANLCGSFWWRDIMKLQQQYRHICSVKVVTGSSVLFWEDTWNGVHLRAEYPRLYSYALDKQLSVKDVLLTADIVDLFYLPLSQQAYEELQLLQGKLNTVHIQATGKDVWQTVWPGGKFTSSRYYHHCFKHITASTIYKWIWGSFLMLRIKVFAWLMVSDRLNTRDMLRRRHWNVTDELHCVLCPGHVVEDWTHLFFTCNFSIRIWNYLQIEWQEDNTFEGVFHRTRRRFDKPFFTEVVVLASWHIWKQRNEAIFQGVMPTFRGWKRAFIHDATLHVHRVKAKHLDSFSQWIETLL